MFRTIPLLCMAAVVSGCASLTYPLPKCDGSSRRPLNRALWQWEESRNVKQEHYEAHAGATGTIAAAYVEEGRGAPAFAHFDTEASRRPCEG